MLHENGMVESMAFHVSNDRVALNCLLFLPPLSHGISLEIFVIGATTYALICSYYDDGIQFVDLTNPASPVAVGAADKTDTGFENLDWPNGASTFVIGSSTYAIVTGGMTDSITMVNISNPAAPVALATEWDGADDFFILDAPREVETFVLGDSTFAIVTAKYDWGVQIVDVSNPSNPLPVGQAWDGAGGFTELYGADSAEVFVIGSTTYAIVVSDGDDGVQMIRLSEDCG